MLCCAMLCFEEASWRYKAGRGESGIKVAMRKHAAAVRKGVVLLLG